MIKVPQNGLLNWEYLMGYTMWILWNIAVINMGGDVEIMLHRIFYAHSMTFMDKLKYYNYM